MKKSKVLIIAILVLSLVLSACATTTPSVPSTNEDLEDITSDEYPVEVVHEPDQTEPEDPEQIYPAEPSEVLDGADDLKASKPISLTRRSARMISMTMLRISTNSPLSSIANLPPATGT